MQISHEQIQREYQLFVVAVYALKVHYILVVNEDQLLLNSICFVALHYNVCNNIFLLPLFSTVNDNELQRNKRVLYSQPTRMHCNTIAIEELFSSSLTYHIKSKSPY